MWERGKHLIFTIMILFFSTLSSAEIIPTNMYGKIVDKAMNNFWGKARLKDGSFVKPNSDKERTTVPIEKADAAQVIKVGEISSVADWCGLEWEKNYFRITKSARRSGLTGNQVAFVGLLHGISMGVVDSALRGKQCSPEIRMNTRAEMKIISNELINYTFTKP